MVRLRRNVSSFGALAAATVVAVACSSAGSFVWVHDLPEGGGVVREADYRIATGDVLSIRVFNQDAMSTRSRVRPDGKMSFPVLGEIEVTGKRPAELAKELERRLKDYVVSPNVSVTIDESPALQVPVVGEVAHPGIVHLEPASGVVHAIASAGGTTDFADRDRIFVVRKRPPQRIRFTYEGLTRGEQKASAFVLQPGDMIVVE